MAALTFGYMEMVTFAVVTEILDADICHIPGGAHMTLTFDNKETDKIKQHKRAEN